MHTNAAASEERKLRVPEDLRSLLTGSLRLGMIGRQHPLADVRSITLAEITAGGPLTATPPHSGSRSQIDAAFDQAGLQPRIAFKLSAPDAVLRIVELGLADSLVQPASGTTPTA